MIPSGSFQPQQFCDFSFFWWIRGRLKKKLLRGQESNLTPVATVPSTISRLSVLWLLCSVRFLKSREFRLRQSVLCRFSCSCFSCMVLLIQGGKAKRLSEVLKEQELWRNVIPVPNVLITKTCALVLSSVFGNRLGWWSHTYGCLHCFFWEINLGEEQVGHCAT